MSPKLSVRSWTRLGLAVVVGEEQIKETHLICALCEAGSEQGPYLKDLHPAGTLFLHVL